jgi:ferredoxin
MRVAATLNRSQLREARAAALAAIGPYIRAATTSVQYRSRGCVLVAGDASAIHAVLGALPPPLKVVALASGAASAAPVPGNVTWVPARAVSIEGDLGCFAAQARGHDGQAIDCSRFSASADGHFDLVLDLHRPPLLRTALKPPGYYAPRNAADLARALPQLRASVGLFERAQYVEYERDACRHGETTPCGRCIPACPAEAISDRGDSIAIDAYRCEGCGLCDGVCPRGALSYVGASLESNLVRLSRMIDAYVNASGVAPRVLVHSNNDVIVAADLPPDVLPFELPAGHAFRIDTWLAALSQEAQQILVFVPFGTAKTLYHTLEQELELCRRILPAIGSDAARVKMVRDTASLCEALTDDTVPHAGAWHGRVIAFGGNKRVNLLACVDYLNAQLASSVDTITLPAASPVGEVQLDASRCNGCGACIEVCSSAALMRPGGKLSALQFIESRCGQCGLCVACCPQHAIGLAPRLLLNARRRDEPRLLESL